MTIEVKVLQVAGVEHAMRWMRYAKRTQGDSQGENIGARDERLARALGIRESVEFRGQVTYDSVLAALASAEVLLFLSRHEAERLPNVVKEAMASRCICIVSRTPGIEELIPNGRIGFIVEQVEKVLVFF